MEITKEKLNQFSKVDFGRIFDYSEMIEPYSKYVESLGDNKIYTGYHTIDKNLYGFRPPELIAVLSEPDIGKTTFVMNFLRHQIESNSFLKNKLLINFSLELNEYDLIERALQMETGFNSFEIESKFKNDPTFKEKSYQLVKRYDNIVNVIQRVHNYQIIPYIKAIEELKEKQAGLIVIDYLQLISSEHGDDYTRTTRNMQAIKEASLLLNLPIIVTSQVSRAAGKESEGIQLTSGKSSGAIEETSQIVFGLEKAKQTDINDKIDANTQDLAKKGKVRIVRMKVLKKKRGHYLTEPLFLILDYSHLKLYEYDDYIQRGIQQTAF